MNKFYTGVGSRNTPDYILEFMVRFAKVASRKGFTLRSGGADGADSAFQSGSNSSKIYLAKHCNTAAMEIAAKFHPAWQKCSPYAKKLHGRNSFQVLGANLNNSSNFLICWTQDGCRSHQDRTIKTGGTGTAISIADKYNIPIYNLNNKVDFAKCLRWIQTIDPNFIPKSKNLSKMEIDAQKLALTHMFNSQSEETYKPDSKKFKTYDRKQFFNDGWIFAGTENDVDPIMEDLFGSLASTLSDYEFSVATAIKCRSAVPLSYGDIGAVAIAKKFHEVDRSEPQKGAACQKAQKMGQLTRQIWEDCSYAGGSVRIPQLTNVGACTIPSHYRPENIAKYANITFKQAVTVSRLYKFLDFDFKLAVKVNGYIRKRKCSNPWDIKVSKNMTLLELAEDLKGINARMELESLADPQYEDWCHHDDGIFSFKILGDEAVNMNNELDESEHNELEVSSMPNEYTYWNQSMIKSPDYLRGKGTTRSFLKIRSAIMYNKLTDKAIVKLGRFVKRMTPSQKTEIKRVLRVARAA